MIMSRKFLIVAVAAVGALAAACGTVATPVFKITDQPEAVEAGSTVVAQAATATPMPSATPIPPTSTPEPTFTPTSEPTAAPTETPQAADNTIGGPAYGANDPQKFTVDNFGSASRGETLFNQTFEIDGAQWACSTCHNVAGDEVKIGPSLYGVSTRALTRVEGEGPYTYLYHSILNPQAYIVPEFEGGTMMPNFSSVLSNSQVTDLIAYLLTLHD
jgi:cytochrome c2